MAGGKGKSTGGKAGPKEAAGKSQKSHSAKAGLQVWLRHTIIIFLWYRAFNMAVDDQPMLRVGFASTNGFLHGSPNNMIIYGSLTLTPDVDTHTYAFILSRSLSLCSDTQACDKANM